MPVEWIFFVAWWITLIAWAVDKRSDRKEREELYNRLISRDLSDYRTGQGNPPLPRENPLRRSIRDAYKHRLSEFDDGTDA